MKRFVALLATAVLIVSLFGVMTAFAGSASVTISKYISIEVGRTYTYTITVNVSKSMDFMGTIKFSGVFKHSPIYLDYHPSSNSSTTITKKFSFKPTSSQLGQTGKISVSGAGDYLDDSGNVVEYSVSGSRTATVVRASSSVPAVKNNKAPAAPTEWDMAASSVEAMPVGGAMTVNITKDPKIPVSLLNTVKEKQAALTIDFGGYTCAIDGKALGAMPKGAKTIDLSMNTEKDDKLSEAVGGKDAYQLHFAYSGQLPGKFSYKFKAENNKPGDALYLYYYYSLPGICEGVQSATVDADGYVIFDIYHCSGYFVSESAIDGAAGVNFAAEAKTEQAVQGTEGREADMQAQLEDAQNLSEELQAELDALKSEDQPVNPLTASVSGPAQNLFGVPYGSLIAALLAAALVSMFFTMLFARVGVFKKRTRNDTDI